MGKVWLGCVFVHQHVPAHVDFEEVSGPPVSESPGRGLVFSGAPVISDGWGAKECG